jgi:hypothetical protein
MYRGKWVEKTHHETMSKCLSLLAVITLTLSLFTLGTLAASASDGEQAPMDPGPAEAPITQEGSAPSDPNPDAQSLQKNNEDNRSPSSLNNNEISPETVEMLHDSGRKVEEIFDNLEK